MTQLDIFEDGRRFPFAIGSHTSFKAACAVDRIDRASKTWRYLDLLAEHGTLTDPEVSALTGWPRSSICSIRFAVENAQLVAKSGEQRRSQYGRACEAYRLTDAGKAAREARR